MNLEQIGKIKSASDVAKERASNTDDTQKQAEKIKTAEDLAAALPDIAGQ